MCHGWGELTLLHAVSCSCFCLLTLKKTFSGTLSECQTVWIQIRTDIMSVLIWVQTFCKGYRLKSSCSCCRLLTFSKLTFSKNFRNTIRVSNSLDPDQDRHVGPDLGPNCLQWLSADYKNSC